MRPTLIIGEWEIDPIDGQIRRPGEVRRLRPKAMAVLMCLADNPDQLIERDAIIAEVWGRELITDEPLTTCIAELRRTLGDSAGSPRYIQTVPKRGYRLVATVTDPASDSTAESRVDDIASTTAEEGHPCEQPVAARAPVEPPAVAATSSSGKMARGPYVWGALIVAAIAILLIWTYQRTSTAPPQSQVPTAPADLHPGPTIAVLPFLNMSPDPDNDYYGDGIAEEVLNNLTRIKGLRVRSRTSSFALKDQNLDTAAIARKLKVSHILEGSIRRSGNTLRISAQLIDVDADTHVWSDVFDKDIRNVFEIQGDIATRVSAALEIALDLDQQLDLANAGTTNTQAYDLYLRGRQLLARRTSVSISTAVVSFSQALELDPNYAQAYLGLADSNLLLPQYNNRPGADYMDKAFAAVNTALEINPDFGEAYATLGSVLEEKGDFIAAEAAFKIALERAPYYPTTYHWYGFLLYRMARQQEAAEMLQLAVEQDPLSNLLSYGMSANLVAMGQFDEAEARYREIIRTDPEFSWAYEGLGELNWNGRGRLEEAAKWYEKAIRYDPDSSYFQALLGAIYLDLGDPVKAGQWIDSAARLENNSFHARVHRALLHIYTGDPDAAYNIALWVLDDDPGNYLAMTILRNLILDSGDPQAAITPYSQAYPELLRENVALDVGNFQAAVDLALVLQRSGENTQAELLLERAWKIAENYPRHGLPYRLSDVKILAMQGQKQEALDVLERSVNSGWRPYWWFFMQHDPALRSLDDDARYHEIMQKIRSGGARGR